MAAAPSNDRTGENRSMEDVEREGGALASCAFCCVEPALMFGEGAKKLSVALEETADERVVLVVGAES